MIGSGGGLWPSDKKWGMVNMILCDTLGKPYTEHQKWAGDKANYVDFVIGPEGDANIPPELKARYPTIDGQKGQYPKTVASWLQEILKETKTKQGSFDSNNTEEAAKVSTKIIGADVKDVDLLTAPDLGYNVSRD